jgi:hypothetical protein
MKEIGSLLDAFYNAVELYPSSKAMTVEHPLVATQLFKNRLKVCWTKCECRSLVFRNL